MEVKEQKPVTKIVKRIKQIVFNQDKTLIGFVWRNQLQRKVDDENYEDIDGDLEGTLPFQGFTVYESQSLKQVVDFHKDGMLERNIKIVRKNIMVSSLAILFQTSTYAVIF